MVANKQSVKIPDIEDRSRIIYGLKWPEYVTNISVELWCYRNNHTIENGGLGQAHHLKNAVRMLFPEHDSRGNPLYYWHEWIDRRIEAWCENRFMTWWGPAAAAKSTDAAMIALVDWLADPVNTTTIICSTTLQMLKRRIFGEVARFHKFHKGQTFGTYLKSRTCIVLDQDKAESGTEKSGIFGFAVQQGSTKEARDNIIGQHNRRIRLIIDEAQHPSLEVAFDARSNLMKGCEDFKLLAFGNPDSRLDPLGRYSEPKVGWEAITPDLEEWPTKHGVCLYFDGLKSPAIKNPRKFGSFLIKQKDIDDTIADQGKDSLDYWQFCRGFVRSSGGAQQIMNEVFAIKYHMLDKPEWQSGYEMVAGLDPSYSSGGDKRVLVTGQIGLSTWNARIISFLEPYEIQIEASKLSDKTYARQLAEKVIVHCQNLAIPKTRFGMDTTGAQNILADYIDEIWPEAGKIHRCEFGGAASELSTSEYDNRPASEVYANRVTELWFTIPSFAKSNQIRGFPMQALKEFTIRQLYTSEQRRARTLKRQIEPKSIMKTRTGGTSPDTADAVCVAIDVARNRMNFHPGMRLADMNTYRKADSDAAYYDLDGRSYLYLTNGIKS